MKILAILALAILVSGCSVLTPNQIGLNIQTEQQYTNGEGHTGHAETYGMGFSWDVK